MYRTTPKKAARPSRIPTTRKFPAPRSRPRNRPRAHPCKGGAKSYKTPTSNRSGRRLNGGPLIIAVGESRPPVSPLSGSSLGPFLLSAHARLRAGANEGKAFHASLRTRIFGAAGYFRPTGRVPAARLSHPARGARRIGRQD